VIRLPKGDVAVALTTDGNGRYCYLDPYEGARLAVAEAARNVACTGARPVAITNCLNFGNPEKSDVMWQFAETVRGIGDACAALGTPVTGGNVSFYNETDGRAIYPTPIIGMLGILDRPSASVGLGFRAAGDVISVAGVTSPEDLGGSEYAKVVNGVVGGRAPVLDLDAERALIGFLQDAAAASLLRSAHDPSLGGLAVAVAESGLASDLGFTLEHSLDHRILFSESPSRVIVTSLPADTEELERLAERHGVALARSGVVGGERFDFGSFSLAKTEARDVFENALPERLAASMEP
jgi:phosphoribosylformylglycinamidine synthase subunit PurL